MNGKQEALRVKKKIEADINELEMSLDQANKANSEEHKQLKRYAGTLMEIEGQVSHRKRGQIGFIPGDRGGEDPGRP